MKRRAGRRRWRHAADAALLPGPAVSAGTAAPGQPEPGHPCTPQLILGLIGALVPFLLLGLRRHAWRPAATARWQQTSPAPLTRDELCQLARWQRLNLLLFAAFVVLGSGGGLLSWTTGLAKTGSVLS